MSRFEKWQVVNGVIQNVLLLATLSFACYLGFRQANINDMLIDLQYAVSVQVTYDPAGSKLNITNTGVGNVFFWGVKFEDEAPKMEANPRVLAQGASFA